MSATIIPFPAPVRPVREAVGEDAISNFLRDFDESRRLNREFNLSGPEWLEVLDLMKTGLSKSEAARIVFDKRRP